MRVCSGTMLCVKGSRIMCWSISVTHTQLFFTLPSTELALQFCSQAMMGVTVPSSEARPQHSCQTKHPVQLQLGPARTKSSAVAGDKLSGAVSPIGLVITRLYCLLLCPEERSSGQVPWSYRLALQQGRSADPRKLLHPPGLNCISR